MTVVFNFIVQCKSQLKTYEGLYTSSRCRCFLIISEVILSTFSFRHNFYATLPLNVKNKTNCGYLFKVLCALLSFVILSIGTYNIINMKTTIYTVSFSNVLHICIQNYTLVKYANMYLTLFIYLPQNCTCVR